MILPSSVLHVVFPEKPLGLRNSGTYCAKDDVRTILRDTVVSRQLN